MYDLIDSVLSMKMDIYRQSDLQDPDTGAIVKQWNYYKTIDCHAKGIISNSATTRSSDKQIMSNKYSNEQVIQVRTLDRVLFREKITNVRNKDGLVIWSEINFPTETPTVFEVMGSTPITDPFGVVIAWNTTMKRSENQQIGL
jgi:hypothetical protein